MNIKPVGGQTSQDVSKHFHYNKPPDLPCSIENITHPPPLPRDAEIFRYLKSLMDGSQYLPCLRLIGVMCSTEGTISFKCKAFSTFAERGE